jgi:hypothetical protein
VKVTDSVKNTLAYNNKESNTAVKGYISLEPVVNLKEFFSVTIYECS